MGDKAFNPIQIGFSEAIVTLESGGTPMCLKCGVKEDLTEYRMPMVDCNCILAICFCSACRKMMREHTKEFASANRKRGNYNTNPNP
jgi:hypothetical protein